MLSLGLMHFLVCLGCSKGLRLPIHDKLLCVGSLRPLDAINEELTKVYGNNGRDCCKLVSF